MKRQHLPLRSWTGQNRICSKACRNAGSLVRPINASNCCWNARSYPSRRADRNQGSAPLQQPIAESDDTLIRGVALDFSEVGDPPRPTDFSGGDFSRPLLQKVQPRQRGRTENYNFCNAAGHTSTWRNNKKGTTLVARGPGVGTRLLGFRWNSPISVLRHRRSRSRFVLAVGSKCD